MGSWPAFQHAARESRFSRRRSPRRRSRQTPRQLIQNGQHLTTPRLPAFHRLARPVNAMNPYGPGWVDLYDQDGPVTLLGGTDNRTTPLGPFLKVWYVVQQNGIGGILAVVEEATHNSEAWGVDEDRKTFDTEGASNFDFGRPQDVTELWWRFHLNDESAAGRI